MHSIPAGTVIKARPVFLIHNFLSSFTSPKDRIVNFLLPSFSCTSQAKMSDDWTNDAKAATKALHKSFENEFHTYPARFLKETKDGAKGKELEFNGDQRPFYGETSYP